MLVMTFVELFWNEQFHGLAYKFFLRVAKELLGPGIGFNNSTAAIDNNQAFTRGFEILFVSY